MSREKKLLHCVYGQDQPRLAEKEKKGEAHQEKELTGPGGGRAKNPLGEKI